MAGDVSERFVPTDSERRAANAFGLCLAVIGFAAIVLTNATGSWWPILASLAFVLAACVGLTAWAARSRQQGLWATFIQIARSR